MPRLKLTLAYVGTKFAGWQLQPGTRTVQGVLEEAVSRIAGRPVRVQGAGRTDSGVHALGQVAHCDVPDEREHMPWRKALNGMLPEDVCVIRAEVMPRSFHARFGATGKTYAYTLWSQYEYTLPQRRPYAWRLANADFALMDEAARQLVGRLDFASFQNTGTPVNSTVRNVYAIWREPGCVPEEVVYRFRAEGFLKQMVRNVMGCMAAVGRGQLAPDDIPDLLAARDRTLAPATAPAHGLCLEQVEYEGQPTHQPHNHEE